MLAPGFADPVHDGQGAFRAVLDALARPGTLQALDAGLRPPAPLTPELAAVALALADADAPLWLDAPLSQCEAVGAYLRFHTGAALVAEPEQAAFALVARPAACPPFACFAQGEPAYPDRSTTLVLALDRLAAGDAHAEGARFVLAGPGIRGTARLQAASLPPDFAARCAENTAGFPLGVDLLLAAPGRIAGLPRSTRVTEA
jgi:alpha-D-ribose 1-methylphosphonate 5-triphosphate synthase subunit PhnH